MTGADLIARILKQEGVDFMGVIPFNTLEEAAAKAGIRPLIFRQERVGVNLADGYTRVTNGKKTGVFSMQAGPGAENAFAGVAHAYADSVPILLMPASNPRDRSGVHPTFSPSRTYESVTKWSGKIDLIEDIPNMMRRAFSQIRLGPPGPVLLETPMDILRGELPARNLNYIPVASHKALGDPQDVKTAANILLSAKRPIIQVGQGVLYAEAWEELKELVELTQVPIMSTMAGKSCFPENHELYLGARSSTTTGMVDHFLRESDVIFGIGCSFTRIHYGADQFDSKVLVHITNSQDDIYKDYSPDHVVMGDAKLIISQLIVEIKKTLATQGKSKADRQDFALEIKSVKAEWMKEWLPKLNSDKTPINPYRAIADLMKAVDRENTVVVHDSGSPRDQMMPFYESLTPHGFIGWGKSTQLGYSLGVSMGAKFASPEKLSIAVIGDYGFGMVGMDVETAVREEIPTLTIILNNATMGIYRPEHFATAHDLFGTKNTSGDYVKMAEAMGAHGERIVDPSDIIPAIKRCAGITMQGQAAVLEIVTDPKEKDMPYRGF